MKDSELNRAVQTTLDLLLASESREQRLRTMKAPQVLIDNEQRIQAARQLALDRLLSDAWKRERRG